MNERFSALPFTHSALHVSDPGTPSRAAPLSDSTHPQFPDIEESPGNVLTSPAAAGGRVDRQGADAKAKLFFVSAGFRVGVLSINVSPASPGERGQDSSRPFTTSSCSFKSSRLHVFS